MQVRAIFLLSICFPHRFYLYCSSTTGNFKEVKKGRLDDYRINKYQSNVVADEFKYGSDKNVVVALEHNVLMANRKDLSKVSRNQ
jgi:hypothetical protein